MRIAFFAALCLAACTQPQAESDTDGAPRGMTIVLLGEPISPSNPILGTRADDPLLGSGFEQAEANPDNSNCVELNAGDVGLLGYDGVVVRMSVHSAGIPTTEGIQVGATAAEVHAAYPNAERQSAEYVSAPGHELFV